MDHWTRVPVGADKMTHKIYIAGITATGKTTTAGKLSEFLKIPFVSLDEAYKKIGDEIKCKPDGSDENMAQCGV